MGKKAETIVGATLGNCKIVKRLGEGAQSVVYLARHQLLDKEVAVKVLAHSILVDKQQLARFLQEARSAARLEHPNIVQIHDAGSEGDTHYMVMQCINGPSLDQRIRRKGPMKPAEVAEMTLQLADALSVAHNEKIVHRDIKPGNILFTRDGVPKLADFGMARDARKGFDITTPGVAVGTPMFMPPEQADGKPADARSDLFSLGAVMYFAMTGKPPFNGDSLVEVLRKVIQDDPPEEPMIKARAPSALRGIVRKLMDKDPAKRFQSAEQLVHELEDYLVGGGGPSRTALRLRAASAKQTARRLKAVAEESVWVRRMFWPALVAAALAWFSLGIAGQMAIGDRPAGLLESFALPWMIGGAGLMLRLALLAAAIGLTVATLRIGRARFEAAEHPLASKTVMISTGVLLYAWSVSKTGDPAAGIAASAAATVSASAASFPGHAAALLLAIACLVSVALLRAWFPVQWLGWALTISAALAALWGGAMSLRPDGGVAGVFEIPGGGPWPVVVASVLAGGLLVLGHRGYWEGRHAVVMGPTGLAVMGLAAIVACAGTSIDLMGDGWSWFHSIWRPWADVGPAARREGAVWVLAVAAGIWAAVMSLQRGEAKA